MSFWLCCVMSKSSVTMAAFQPVMPVPSKAGQFFRRLSRVVGLALLASPVVAISTIVLDTPEMSASIKVRQDSAIQPRDWQTTYATLDPMVTQSIALQTFQPVTLAKNELLKNDTFLTAASALDIATSFQKQRVNIAALRLDVRAKTTRKTKSAPTNTRFAKIDQNDAAIDPIQLASLGKSALDAINQATDPENTYVPRPVLAPAHLAYARAHPEITEKQSKPKPTNKKAMSASKKQLWCLATGIYFEARGESYRGQVAVAQVIVNRTKHKAYPRTICGVVFQNQSKRNRCQFSFACDGVPERIHNKKLWAQANDIAKKVVRGKLYLTAVANSTHYHATYVNPKWARKLKRMTKIGAHIFYRFKHS